MTASLDELRATLGVGNATARNASLADKYVMPPFSVLNTMAGDWQARKRYWLALGIKSELGRGEALMGYGDELRADNMDFYRAESKRARAYAGGGVYDFLERERTSKERREAVEAAHVAERPDMGLDEYRPRTPAGGLLSLGSSATVGEKWHGTPSDRPKAADTEAMFDGSPAVDTSRRSADRNSNVTGAPPLPEYAQRMGVENMAPGTSIFDPVLCELVYRWFCPPGGSILDPFSGGSVRGIVAAYMGHPYTGVDLSAPQVAANREQAQTILLPHHPVPEWIVGDSTLVLPGLDRTVDFVWTCPPYFDLEVYSDDPRDLSAMGSYAAFLDAYDRVIEGAAARLHSDRFAAIVVGEVRNKRDPDGAYVGLVPDTIRIFESHGLRFYNEIILNNAAGSLPVRVGRQFDTSRKIGKHHQNVLVFLKGHVPRGWSVEREAPPSPQVAMFADEELRPVPIPDPPGTTEEMA